MEKLLRCHPARRTQSLRCKTQCATQAVMWRSKSTARAFTKRCCTSRMAAVEELKRKQCLQRLQRFNASTLERINVISGGQRQRCISFNLPSKPIRHVSEK